MNELEAKRQLLVWIKADYELTKMQLQRKGEQKRRLEDEIEEIEKL